MSTKTTAALFVSLALAAGCGGGAHAPGDDSAAQSARVPSPAPTAAADLREGRVGARATIEARSGSALSGTAEFAQEAGAVTLRLDVRGAVPGPHAVHLHEKGDCSAADATSAGPHWNPTGVDHGRWGQEPFHHGDIGNLVVGEDGSGTLVLTTDLWTIGDGAASDIVGRAIIVHEKVDDFTTQPTGAAGGRIGCGVIER